MFKNKSRGREVIARVGDIQLQRSEIEGIVPLGTGRDDSVTIVRAYIDNWIRQLLMLKQAELNLSSELQNFQNQLEEYRKSLLIYTYQEKLVEQMLDTAISEAEIKKYYEENEGNFALHHNIVKARYVTFPRGLKDQYKIRNLFRSPKIEDQEKLMEYCRNGRVSCFLDDSTWILMDELEKIIPIEHSSQENFLSYKRYVEINDSSHSYLLRIIDYKIKESTSPLEFERLRIKSIILNIRKLELLRKMEEDLFQEAEKNGAFEIYPE